MHGLELHDYATTEANYIDSRVWFTHEELFEGTIHTEFMRRKVQLDLITAQGFPRPYLDPRSGFVDPTHIHSVDVFPGYAMLTGDLGDLTETWCETHPDLNRYWYSRQSFKTLCGLLYKGAKRKT